MKRLISRISGFAVVLVMVFTSCNAQNVDQKNKQQEIASADNIKVMYFHFSRRCATCKAVEAESEKAVKDLYSEEMKEGKIVFESINLDLEEGEKKGEEYGINSQSLVVIKGDQQTDLTTEGFMNALTKPERIKELIKKTVEAYR